MNNYYFVLGAKDPEMQEIMRVLDSQNIPYGFASIAGVPVNTSEAQKANGVNGLIPRGSKIVFVECEVLGLYPDAVCDHHNEGDPGYGMPPERYMEGSSLGQVLKLLGIEPSHEQRIIAAADHCLKHAYDGRCPGVTPEELADWRERSRAALREITVEEIRSRIDAAIEVLKNAPRIKIADEEVAFFSEMVDRQDETQREIPPEISEASARSGIPYCYVYKNTGGAKAKIMSAAPRTIRTWMRECGLRDVYGDPARGFAGGYL